MEKVEKKEAKLTDKIGGVPASELMQKMINQSDNPAWKQINEFLGKDGLANYARSHGMTSYEPERNVVTSNDMALLLAKLYKRELINEEHTKLLLSWMQKTSEERFIPAAIPAGTALYHKAGYLEDRAHDVAIIDNGTTPYVLVIYSKSYTPGYNFQSGQRLFKEATNRVQQTFNQ
jgi:beta-lactamase class A